MKKLKTIKGSIKSELSKEIEKLKDITDEKEYKEQLTKIERLAKLKNIEKSKDYFKYLKLSVEVMGILLPLAFYSKMFAEGLKFEQDNSFSAVTFKNLYSKIRPTK